MAIEIGEMDGRIGGFIIRLACGLSGIVGIVMLSYGLISWLKDGSEYTFADGDRIPIVGGGFVEASKDLDWNNIDINTVSNNTYFGAKMSVGNYDLAEGWQLQNFAERTRNILNKASLEAFGNEMTFKGVGGSIPFITYFQSKYPNCDVICTGILGNDSNEHGPNENLNIEAAKKMILVLCYYLSEI